MWPRTDLIDLLGIKHPIIQAPMAGSTTPLLVGEVSKAGGLGSLGCAEMSVENLRFTTVELRALTDLPFNLNFFAHSEPEDVTRINSEIHAQLINSYREYQLGEPPTSAKSSSSLFSIFDKQLLSAVLEINPRTIATANISLRIDSQQFITKIFILHPYRLLQIN